MTRRPSWSVTVAVTVAETGAIVELLTESHGRYAAHVAGGASRKMKPFLQPGARVVARFRARTAEQLGSATLEPMGEGPSSLFDDPLALAGIASAEHIVELADELVDVRLDVGSRHPVRDDDDRAAVLAVGRDAAPSPRAAAYLDALGQAGDLDHVLAHRHEPNPRHGHLRPTSRRCDRAPWCCACPV